MATGESPDARTIMFNESKKEACTLKQGFRQLQRRLKTTGGGSAYRCQPSKDEITLERLRECDIALCTYGDKNIQYIPTERFNLISNTQRRAAVH